MLTRILLAGVVALAVSITTMAEDQVTLQNPGFELPDISKGAEMMATPDGWFHFSSTPEKKAGITTDHKQAGSQSLCFKAQADQDAFQGVAQKFSAVSGKPYSFNINVLNDPNDPIVGKAFGQISFEWRDSTGKEITRTYGPTWNSELAPNKWQKFTIDADAPSGATEGTAVITFFAKDCKGMGTFYIDDTELIFRGK